MPFPKNPLKGFDFTQKLCLNCDTPIETGLFCSNCRPEGVLGEPEDEGKIALLELASGEVAYVPMTAMFTAGGELWINGECLADLRPEPGYSVKIRRRQGEYSFEVDNHNYAELRIPAGVPKPMPLAIFVCQVVAF